MFSPGRIRGSRLSIVRGRRAQPAPNGRSDVWKCRESVPLVAEADNLYNAMPEAIPTLRDEEQCVMSRRSMGWVRTARTQQ